MLPYLRGRLVITPRGGGRFTCEVVRGPDTRVDRRRRWAMLWVHYEAEEPRVHHGTTIPSEEARAVVVALRSSGSQLRIQNVATGAPEYHRESS
jgi:hypothetical protein